MSFFDHFKELIKRPQKEIKKPEKKIEKPRPLKEKKEDVLVEKKETKEEKESLKKKKSLKTTFEKIDIGDAHRVIVSPLVSEKATDLISCNQYVFKVRNCANKVEVKKAVSRLYGVIVTDVRIINIPKKRRRLGRSEGYKSGYKKAVVSLKKGDKIEILPH